MLNEFWNEKGLPDGKKRICIPCAKADRKAYYDNNRDKMIAKTMNWRKGKEARHLANMKAYRLGLKQKLVNGYGGKCTCCGEATLQFLTIEHLNGDGQAHRKAMKSSQGTYRDIISRNFPPEYTVLCMNCNHAKRFGNICPHQAAITIAKAEGAQ